MPIDIPGPRVVGLDLSLTGSGIAVISSHRAHVTTLEPKGMTGHRRLAFIADKVRSWCADADLVVIEGASYNSSNKAFDMGGGWWVVTHIALWREGHPYVVVPPATMKRYACGSGKAGKEQVGYEAVRRFPGVMVTNNNEADALWLAHMGADWLGWPMVKLPQAHRAALDAVRTWPEREGIGRFPAANPAIAASAE